MGQVIDQPVTYADIEALPPNVAGETLFGKLETHPRPVPRQAFAASFLGFELDAPFQKECGGPGGSIILDETEMHVSRRVVVSEIAGWRQQTISTLPETSTFQVGPNSVCEFRSPSTQRHSKSNNRAIYADEIGVGHLWYDDPADGVLDVFTSREQEGIASCSFFDDDPVSALPFDTITFLLGGLWPSDPSTPPKPN